MRKYSDFITIGYLEDEESYTIDRFIVIDDDFNPDKEKYPNIRSLIDIVDKDYDNIVNSSIWDLSLGIKYNSLDEFINNTKDIIESNTNMIAYIANEYCYMCIYKGHYYFHTYYGPVKIKQNRIFKNLEYDNGNRD